MGRANYEIKKEDIIRLRSSLYSESFITVIVKIRRAFSKYNGTLIIFININKRTIVSIELRTRYIYIKLLS